MYKNKYTVEVCSPNEANKGANDHNISLVFFLSHLFIRAATPQCGQLDIEWINVQNNIPAYIFNQFLSFFSKYIKL